MEIIRNRYLFLDVFTHFSLINLIVLLDCLDEIKWWMASNFLQLNESKFKVLILGPPKSVNQIALDLGPLASNVNTQVRNLGVIFFFLF